MNRALAIAAPALVAALVPGCGGGRSRSPVCGMAQIVAPTMIQQQLNNATAIIADPPRGLPDPLPARVAGNSEQGDVRVGYDKNRQLVLGFENAAFINRPECRGDTTGRCGYGLLVVDDTSERVEGVLVYQSQAPGPGYPRLGVISSGELVLPVFGVRVDWLGLNNPKCPLLGAPAPGAK
ncbi:MAG TPA: hypothetical protein VFK78_03605 [Gemmatimonadales bacterium]|nr:hypothetical protein [Gemmatimonadales bacterium]